MRNLSFAEAIKAVKEGKNVCRYGWNGKGMYVFLMPDEWVTAIENNASPEYPVEKCLCMKTAKDTIQIGWLASQADMLAEDWEILE